jgi:hypothetical protein
MASVRREFHGAGFLCCLLLGGIGLFGCRLDQQMVPAGPATQPVQASKTESDAEVPEVPDRLNIKPDTSLVVAAPDSAEVFYRTLITIAFDASASGVTVRKVLATFKGTIVGGYPKAGPKGSYVIEVEDRGARWPRIAALMDNVRAEPGVFSAAPMPLRIVKA